MKINKIALNNNVSLQHFFSAKEDGIKLSDYYIEAFKKLSGKTIYSCQIYGFEDTFLLLPAPLLDLDKLVRIEINQQLKEISYECISLVATLQALFRLISETKTEKYLDLYDKLNELLADYKNSVALFYYFD